MSERLNQVIAIEKATKNRINDQITKLYQDVQKRELVAGISRTYQPKDEEGEKYPSEGKQVQVVANNVLEQTSKLMTELFDLTRTKDEANCTAKADVRLEDGTVILSKVPVAHLLFLEKQLIDLHTIIAKLPTLPPDVAWHKDPASPFWVSDVTQTVKTKKVPRNHVKAEATKEHPAQVDVYHEDVVVGTWSTVYSSGAISAQASARLLDRIEKLQAAVKIAREEANVGSAPKFTEGKAIFDFILG